LRPGEKLYEELLLGVNPQRTNHPKIQMASDPFIPFNKLEISLNNLKSILDSNKAMEAKKVLEEILELYKSNSKIVDHYHAEQKWLNKKKNDLSLKKIQNNVVKFK
jgi:FlaA1/EpsC-like NDP-sugar epimerase